MVKVIINDKEYEFEEGITILEACKKLGINIPTLCYYEFLEPRGVCRICVVEVNNKLLPSCSTKIQEGMKIYTHSDKVIEARKMNIMLLISDHKQECLSCNKAYYCKLFELANEYGITDIPLIVDLKREYYKDDSSYAYIRDLSKCIKCGKCVDICNNLQTVNAIDYAYRGFNLKITTPYEIPINESKCTFCGQCVLNCPTCALEEKSEIEEVWKIINDPNIIVGCQIAPSVRVSLGEEFGFEPGEIVTKKIVTALKLLGFNYVFDTQFGADLTIVEEAHEFVERLKTNKNLPMFTSCCPAWIKFVEEFYPEFLDNLSSCKSPQQMFGAIFKTYFVNKIKKDVNKVKLVSIMPCTAKKFEARRYELLGDVDYVITTRELARMIKEAGIDFKRLKESDFDHPLGESSGAGAIFGSSGGVMEAALRTVYEILTNKTLQKLEFNSIRGLDFSKEGEIEINGKKIRFLAVHTLGSARKILEKLKNKELNYHFIEVMACPGGCIGGGGQPIPTNKEILKKRMNAIYLNDKQKKIRKSHENPAIKKIYNEFLKHPLSHIAHKLLHTKYINRKEHVYNFILKS